MQTNNQIPRAQSVRMMLVSAVCLALCLFLPFLTGQIPSIGNALSPMHIPVLLCGFLCGPAYGAAVGLIAPLLRFVLFGMPPLFPTGVAMCVELMVYGLVTGLLYARLSKRPSGVYIALITAMIAGRAVWGIVYAILASAATLEFSFAIFLTRAFVTAVPGIICHIVLIPIVVMALHKSRVLKPRANAA